MQYRKDYQGLSTQIKPWAIRSEEEYQHLQKAQDELEKLSWTDGRSMMIEFLTDLIRTWKTK